MMMVSSYIHQVANYVVTMYLSINKCLCPLDFAVRFDQSTYSISEGDGPLQPVLILSNPSSTDITLQIRTNDNTTTGE